MKMEQCIGAIAGTFILISVDWAISITGTGFSLLPLSDSILQSAFTKWCLMEDIL